MEGGIGEEPRSFRPRWEGVWQCLEDAASEVRDLGKKLSRRP